MPLFKVDSKFASDRENREIARPPTTSAGAKTEGGLGSRTSPIAPPLFQSRGRRGTSATMYASRWLTLVLSQFVMVSSGTLYLFPVYSPMLKSRLDLTQEEVNFVGSAAHFGAFFSVFGGFFYDAFGPRATLTLGGALKLGGLLTMALTIQGVAPQSHRFAAFCAWVFGTGCSTSLTASLGANYATFKDHNLHGRLVGLILAFFGLSSGILSLVYDVFFTSPVSFVYFLALFAGGMDLFAATLVGSPKNLALPDDEPEGGRGLPLGGVGPAPTGTVARLFGAADHDAKLTRGLTLCGAVAIHVAVSALLIQSVGGVAAVTIACLLVTGALMTAQSWSLLGGGGRVAFRRNEMAQVDPRLNAANKAALEGVGPTKLPFLLDFWLFFIAMMLGIGAGVTVVNNLSQMVSAYPTLAPDAAATSRSLMKLLACTNTLGRLASGSLSDKLAHKVGRVQFTVYLLALMAVGQFILAAMGGESAPLFGLVVGVFVVGWAFGALFWATPLLVMELFGPKNFGANRGLVGLSPAIGGYVMSTLVAGRVYAASAGLDNDCDAGAACYGRVWVFNAFAVVGATGMMWWLARRRARGRGMGPIT